MTRAYDGKGALPPERYGSIDKAMAAARREIPGNNPQFIGRSEEHTSELQSLMRISYAVLSLKTKKETKNIKLLYTVSIEIKTTSSTRSSTQLIITLLIT